MRLFIAIPLPDTAIQAVAGLRKEMQGVRWVPPEQLHLTLCFLGDVESHLPEALCRALKTIAVPSFSLTFNRIGCFPHPDAPRVIWMGLKKQAELEHLALQVKEAVASCGIMIEDRPFTPHITLARIKPPASDDLRHYLARPVAPEIPAVQVRDFVLFQSILSGHSTQHIILNSFTLQCPA